MLVYLANTLTLLGIAIILAGSLNIMVGYAGIFSVAHAVFYGVGAYTAGLVALHYSSNFLVATGTGVLVTSLLAFCLAFPVLRVKDEYFVVASIGFQVVASTIFMNWHSVTGGMGGLSAIPNPKLFGWIINSPVSYLGLTLGCVLIVLGVIWAFVRSSLGRGLEAFRDDEIAAVALGKSAVALRVIATTLSGGLAAISGAIYAFYVSFVNPESFTLDYSVMILAMVVIGGAGSTTGPIIGAVFITIFPMLLDFLKLPGTVIGPLQQLIYGGAIILLMIFLPGGLVSVRVRRHVSAREGAGSKQL